MYNPLLNHNISGNRNNSISENTLKKVKDNYINNPIHILSNNEHKDIYTNFTIKNKNKIDRISNIYSSTLIKNRFDLNKNQKDKDIANNKDFKYQYQTYVQPAKIFNQNSILLTQAAKEYTNPRKKRFSLVIDNKRGFYMG
jgi:hypothetical protein